MIQCHLPDYFSMISCQDPLAWLLRIKHSASLWLGDSRTVPFSSTFLVFSPVFRKPLSILNFCFSFPVSCLYWPFLSFTHKTFFLDLSFLWPAVQGDPQQRTMESWRLMSLLGCSPTHLFGPDLP